MTLKPSVHHLSLCLNAFSETSQEKAVPKGERLEALNIEVILSPEKATMGVPVPVGVPVFYTCRQCGGSGRDWLFPCVDCNAQGIIKEEKTVKVRIPPMAPDGTVLEVPIHGLRYP